MNSTYLEFKFPPCLVPLHMTVKGYTGKTNTHKNLPKKSFNWPFPLQCQKPFELSKLIKARIVHHNFLVKERNLFHTKVKIAKYTDFLRIWIVKHHCNLNNLDLSSSKKRHLTLLSLI